MRKLYAQPKLRTVKSKAGWNQRESTIALISIVIAAIGSVASAGSTFLAYKQLEVSNRERMTPYLSILYNAKVESYKQVHAALAKLDEPLLITRFYYDGAIDPRFDIAVKKKESRDHEIAKNLRSLDSATQDSFNEIEPNSVVWENGLVVEIGKLKDELREVEYCYTAQYDEVLGKGLNAYQTACPPATLAKRLAVYDARRAIVLRKMREEIRADSFTIRPLTN